MKFPTTGQLQQVHLGIGSKRYEPVASYQGNKTLYTHEHEILQSSILGLCPEHLWYHGSNAALCPRPILITNEHQRQLEQLHNALTTAIVDIVKRWWTDLDARFPERMPLMKNEEDLLRWLESQNSHNGVPYEARLGSWRPDFLVGSYSDGPSTETYRLTEINARFSFNGFMHLAYGQEGLSDLGAGRNGLIHATDSSKILNGLLSLFNPSRPLHLLKGEEPGIDIHMFIDFVHRHIGIRPRLITPADLRLIPDPKSPDRGRLCCLVRDQGHTRLINESPLLLTSNGEVVEEIHQVGLELHQHELFGLSPEILHEVSLRCFNDMRTILLVHDKRMLGIIKQEIPSLVAREVLTPAQGEALDAGIADSFIPGSPELNELIQTSAKSPDLRKEYLLKPIRGGKGAGILFGDEVGADEWLSTLERLRNPHFVSGNTMYVVQRRIWPRLYEVILKSSGDRGHYPLIGTYHTTNGQLLGLGTWRSSPDRICAVSHGGAWICSVLDEYSES
ncbi:hypothetical protein ANOM_000200 [Aspergillus nomiae NRRL 13137]|uniref:Uncharacterized protein n=1 Tax=Aspergillus nomiae NRRL (strain ATCC 15546 / NRRL 13137 / CBS 260.88 / M93) TaxID=1509407 RepID=A0A0L1JIS1_ASPN3|nr:uncharacterized protein ANOM_000200 [Aspergillus nomiae NRRL 13137]KNG91646.1 hypothetical protein ANOM_000200 [Aspergillus nomiae NRRL 13137]